MRLTPASRHRSTWRRASATSVAPTAAKPPLPPNVIVPMVSTETMRPDRPSARYSTRPPYPAAAGSGAQPLQPVQEQVERELELDLAVAPAQGGVGRGVDLGGDHRGQV